MQADAPALLPWAVEGYFWHCWKSRFPATPTPTNKPHNTNPAHLRDKLIRALKHQHKENVDIKESFHEQNDGDSVRFTLLVKYESVGQWVELLTLDRPRVKTARLAAYDAALKDAAGVVLD